MNPLDDGHQNDDETNERPADSSDSVVPPGPTPTSWRPGRARSERDVYSPPHKRVRSNPNEITVKLSRRKQKRKEKKESEGKCCPSFERLLTISFFTACFLRFCSILLSFLVFLSVMMFAQSRFNVLQFWILIGCSACVLAFQVAKLLESCSEGMVPEEEFLLDMLWKQKLTPLLWFKVRTDMTCCCSDENPWHPIDFVTSVLFILAVPLLFPWDVYHDISNGCPRLFT